MIKIYKTLTISVPNINIKGKFFFFNQATKEGMRKAILIQAGSQAAHDMLLANHMFEARRSEAAREDLIGLALFWALRGWVALGPLRLSDPGPEGKAGRPGGTK